MCFPVRAARRRGALPSAKLPWSLSRLAPTPREAPMQPVQEAPILNLTGEKVALGPLRRDLLPLYDRWFNDSEVGRHYFAQVRPHTREEREAWYERLAKGEPNTAQFLIYERATLRPIGKTHLDEIDHFNRTAAFGIFI